MIVLDTHIFIWYVLDDPRLERRLKRELQDQSAAVRLPSICVWEFVMLAEKGRLDIGSDRPATLIRQLLDESQFEVAPLTSEIAILSRTLDFRHGDPTDHFVAATAYALRAKLATADVMLRSLPWLELA